MSKTLLLISLGPVQSMIAQAKRTRDLWMGSFLISEISKAATKALSEMNAELIFPALDKGSKELMPSEDPVNAVNVANKIVARIEGDGKPYAQAARKAAKNRLKEWGLKVLHENSELVEPDIEKTAEEQLDSLLEYWAVWAPLDKNYDEVRTNLESELQARKYLCPFRPWQHQREDLWKSSLDGARQSVLKRCEYRTGDAWTQYRIGMREELDAIGLLKRTGRKPEQFVPVPSIGLAPWIALAAKECQSEMDSIKKLCREARFQYVNRRMEWVQCFPYDGQIFLEDRLQPYCKECGKSEYESPLRKEIERIKRKIGDPFPFVACLVADGDHMGIEIKNQAKEGYEAHRAFSKRLSSFAAEARTIVESEKHRGVLVYSGGDDVLALLNLEDALKCADELQNAFKLHIGGDVTLSVGLGIGGVIESLGDLFEFGRQAEKEAKKDRNALAILIQKRGGSQRLWSCSWNDKPTALIEKDKDLLRKGYLSTKKIYQAGDMLRKMPKPNDEEGAGQWKDALYLEWSRILSRNEGKDLPFEEFGLQKQGNYKTQYKTIERWISRLEIAHILQQAEPRSDLNTQEEAK